MRPLYPGEAHTVTEWAIRWTAPEDIADSITILLSEERAHAMLRMSPYNSGEIVRRVITYSAWKST